MLPSVSSPEAQPPGGPAGVLDLVALLANQRKLLVRVPVAAVVLGFIVAFAWPKSYQATARILPPQQGQSSAAAMLAQLGGAAAGLAGGALGLKAPSDLYVGMLKSDTVADALITRFDLRKVYREELLVETRKRLADDSYFSTDKAGIISIKAEARDPKLAADLANAYVEELQHLTSTLAVTEASQRRLFFEQQLQLSKDKLAAAELNLRQAIEKGGIVSVDAQSRAALETVGRLRAQISAKEVQINAMRAFATAENPDLVRAEGELGSIRRELERLESGSVGGADTVSVKGIDSVRLLREVKYQEVLFELMAKQYELARVDEAKQAPMVQFLDRAAPPEKKSRPQRSVVILGFAFAGLAAALAGAYAREWWGALRRDPAASHSIERIRTRWNSPGDA